MKDILKQAQKNYPKGTRFLTATGNITTPLVVDELKISVNYPNTIISDSGGVIYTENVFEAEDEEGNITLEIFPTWAKKANLEE